MSGVKDYAFEEQFYTFFKFLNGNFHFKTNIFQVTTEVKVNNNISDTIHYLPVKQEKKTCA